MQTPTTDDDTTTQQRNGVNDQGCPFLEQTVDVGVQNASAVLASLGFSSVAELVAAAGLA